MGEKLSEEEQREKISKTIKDESIKFVSLQFVDILGNAKNCDVTTKKIGDVLMEGLWFDGSSVEGFMRIHESDMLLKPDISTFTTIPWSNEKAARVVCDVCTVDGKPFEGDPRSNLKRVVKNAKEKGYEFKVGPELEFFLFRTEPVMCALRGEGRTAIQEPHDTAGYWDLSPIDLAVGVKREIMEKLDLIGLGVERGHHEVAPGQHEIGLTYGDPVTMADNVLTYKNAVKVIASKYNLFASFMPKPISGINGSGMHTHQSLWTNGKNAFFDANDEYKLSKTAYEFIGGQLSNAEALAGVVAPTVNSYKRLVPGYEAPVYVFWARINRSALIRVPKFVEGKDNACRIELRCPDPSCNPYLAFAAMLQTGLDGIKNKMEAPKPLEENVYHFDDKKLQEFKIKTLPESLRDATEKMSKSAVIREALGDHIFEKLIEAQQKQWNSYRTHVSIWETKRYLPIL
ncbi:MAG: type I glutamate--ammonia ligase [Candidatus Micrarchaeales archaeon]|jgi:glutamine synthetase